MMQVSLPTEFAPTELAPTDLKRSHAFLTLKEREMF